MKLTENGVEPTEGGAIDMDPEKEAEGIDTILEFAIETLNRLAEKNNSSSTPAKIIAQTPRRNG